MATIKFFSGGNLPLEMHKVRIVQKLTLPPIEYRLKAVKGRTGSGDLTPSLGPFARSAFLLPGSQQRSQRR